eukprot:TRINITY_DN31031_c0_g1_i1.p1 TRINITY_DN31031_c0_g1~~TRINITY_DN31031_c0_g1_i1.p1  ORF type:complete len:239 (-),score=52.15 TRINITY_DN31031_c0_g1_i1:233-949(-)
MVVMGRASSPRPAGSPLHAEGRYSPPPRLNGQHGASSRSAGLLPSRHGHRSPSPPKPNMNDLDQNSIVALSQQRSEDLDAKHREKRALTTLLAELKRKKLNIDSKISKKQRDVDHMVVQTIDTAKKLEGMTANNKMLSGELSGLRSENERMEAEVEQLRVNLQEACVTFDTECMNVEKAKRLLYNYRKEISAETKQRDSVQSDLRASRTAQTLMINRLDEMEKRNNALKSCVANTFRH